MKSFEIIDISGDVGIRAFGASLEEVFKNSAIGMYSLITDVKDVETKKNITVSVESHSLDGLMVSWLNELIFHFDTYNFIGKEIMIAEITPSLTLPPRGGGLGGGGSGRTERFRLKASVAGEEFDAERHESKLLIKAATYHRLKVEEENGRWKAEVIFDI